MENYWKVLLGEEPLTEDFIYAVKTTGIYCRPHCAARLPKKENVLFYQNAQEAQKHGFRACKRCLPDNIVSKEQALITQLCRLIEKSPHELSLEELAQGVNLSATYLQKFFKKQTLLSPKEYAQINKSEKIRSLLKRQQEITASFYETGYNSSSRFYEVSDKILGMTPTQYQNQGKNMKIHFALSSSSLGYVLIAKTTKGVCAIQLGSDKDILINNFKKDFKQATLIEQEDSLGELLVKVIDFIEQPVTNLDLPLDIKGTVFQKKVWDALQKIPLGQTLNYSEVATLIGLPRAARAVANACGQNPVCLAIPCHRVIHKDGTISGYRWGIERKKEILKREKK